jgi:hypothetical protein
MQRNKDPERATSLKNEGNRLYQAGDYVGAESLYSKAYVNPMMLALAALTENVILTASSPTTPTLPSTQTAPWRD